MTVNWVDGIWGSGQSGTVKNGGVENAGVNNSAPFCRNGICRSGQISTMWQGWTMQEWSEVTKAAYKITSLAHDSLHI